VQYVTGIKSSRHKITNNLPGTVDFALSLRQKIRRKLMRLFPIKDIYLNNIHKDVVQEPLLLLLKFRASLLLKMKIETIEPCAGESHWSSRRCVEPRRIRTIATNCN
jgi:hypothetical protein